MSSRAPDAGAQMQALRQSQPSARERFSRIPVAPVEVDGERFYVRALSAADLKVIAPLMQSADDDDVAAVAELAARVACACLCESEAGGLVYEPDDLEFVRTLPFARLRPVLEAVIDLSGFDRVTTGDEGDEGDEGDSGN